MRRGLLVVLSGPSGVGKTTVARELLRDATFARAVTATTRSPRPGEVDGRDYRFLEPGAFAVAVGRGEFLEHAEVHGRSYGTPREEVERILDSGRTCLLVIDVQGAATLRGAGFPALSVFLAPPSEEALRERLLGRGTEAGPERRLRFENALRHEIPRRSEFDAVVVNDDVPRAAAEVRRLVEARLGGVGSAGDGPVTGN